MSDRMSDGAARPAGEVQPSAGVSRGGASRRGAGWLRIKLALTTLALVGYGPFICDQPDVEEARTALRTGQPAAALRALAEVEDDVAPVHLARGLAHLQTEAPAAKPGSAGQGAAGPGAEAAEATGAGSEDEAKAALDQAYRVVANADARGESLEQAPALRARIAFARGLLAARAKDWTTAQVEFAKVLALDPEDEDARWNLELAWSKANPPCNQREDDHEPDDGREGAPPFDPEKSQQRVLCPGNEDHYTLPELPRGAMLYVRLKGQVKPDPDLDALTREVSLALLAPSDGDEAPQRLAPVVGGVANVAVAGLPEGGNWVVRVAGPGPAEFSYGLEVEVVPPCPADDELEENDTREAAKVLSEPEYKGLKACPGDPDWYVIEVPKDEGRKVTVGFDPTRAPLTATVFGPDGETPLAAGRSAKGGLQLKLPKGTEAQRFLLEIRTETASENNYGLKIEKDDGEEGKDEQDDQKDDQQDEPKDDQKDEPKDDQKDEPKDDQKDQPGEEPKPEAPKPEAPKDDEAGESPQPDEPKPPEEKPTEAVDLERLLESLDKHPRNPQLEKALKALPVLPQMEDY